MENSYWLTHSKPLQLPPLNSDQNIDIAIVGGGITGILLAYYLMATNTSFLLIEADQIGYGASGRSTGKITTQHSLCYHYLRDKFDEKVAKAYYTANKEALESIASIIEENGIECGFSHVDSITYTNRVENKQMIDDEIAACQSLGIPCKKIEQSEYPITFVEGIVFKEQAQFNPVQFLQALAKIITAKGHQIYEHSALKELQKEEDGYTLFVNNHTIKAKKVVLATQFPFIDDNQLYFSKLFNEQSRLYCAPFPLQAQSQLISADEDVYSYRTFKDNETHLLFGSNHHRVGEKTKEIDFLAISKEQFQLSGKITNWSSQDYFTGDRMPLIGRLNKNDKNLLFASGYQKWGNTLGCVAAKLLCALLIGQESQYTALFDPHRSGLLMNMTSLKENSKTALSLLLGKLDESDESIPSPGSASTILMEGKKYGVYVDENGTAHMVDITCPHMGCTLTFNHTDKTWDCPCHGSRFDYNGEIIRGPASTCLQNVEENNKINPHIIIKKRS